MRSAQCAALIALAAAAGISRFESPDMEAHEAAHEPSRPVAEARTLGSAKPTTYQLSINRPTPWAEPLLTMVVWCLSVAEDNSAAKDGANTGSAGSLEAADMASDFATRIAVPVAEHFTAATLAPSVRQQRFPYPVGPPARGSETSLRAEGTYVPGDSAARRSLGIAASLAVSHARVTRHLVRGVEFAGPNFSPIPSVALRGQPEIFHRQLPRIRRAHMPSRRCAQTHFRSSSTRTVPAFP